MKRILRPALFAALAFGASTVGLFAQTPSPSPQGPPDGPPPGHHGPPPSPLFRALDANHDGVISADEIANAPTVLKTLAGPSGQITHESLRPARREDDRRDGPGGDDRRDDRRPRPDDSQGPGPEHQNRRHGPPPPPPDAQDSPAGTPDGQANPPRPQHRPEDRRHGPPPDGERDQKRSPDASASPGANASASPDASPAPGRDGPRHGPPHGDRLFDVLDANHDGVISADEIEAAATSLKKADTNGDGQIDRQDMRPPPPPPAPGE